ncbi:hypothetical protein POP12_175 [Pectobacterium phage POP12]|nr:hypothetical protein POP12_175 [Pectobacterium phage POP12]
MSTFVHLHDREGFLNFSPCNRNRYKDIPSIFELTVNPSNHSIFDSGFADRGWINYKDPSLKNIMKGKVAVITEKEFEKFFIIIPKEKIFEFAAKSIENPDDSLKEKKSNVVLILKDREGYLNHNPLNRDCFSDIPDLIELNVDLNEFQKKPCLTKCDLIDSSWVNWRGVDLKNITIANSTELQRFFEVSDNSKQEDEVKAVLILKDRQGFLDHQGQRDYQYLYNIPTRLELITEYNGVSICVGDIKNNASFMKNYASTDVVISQYEVRRFFAVIFNQEKEKMIEPKAPNTVLILKDREGFLNSYEQNKLHFSEIPLRIELNNPIQSKTVRLKDLKDDWVKHPKYDGEFVVITEFEFEQFFEIETTKSVLILKDREGFLNNHHLNHKYSQNIPERIELNVPITEIKLGVLNRMIINHWYDRKLNIIPITSEDLKFFTDINGSDIVSFDGVEKKNKLNNTVDLRPVFDAAKKVKRRSKESVALHLGAEVGEINECLIQPERGGNLVEESVDAIICSLDLIWLELQSTHGTVEIADIVQKKIDEKCKKWIATKS